MRDYDSHLTIFFNISRNITLFDGETTLRLVDDAFIKICSAVNDLCMQVRALACTLLGTTRQVSDRFLLQTLDKQLMSNMKVINYNS